MDVRNDTLGLGLPVFSSGVRFGSTNQLQGIVHYPNDNFFDLAETGSLHETGHRWINYLTLPSLAQGRPHWPIGDLASGIMGFSNPQNGEGLEFPFTLMPLPTGDFLVQQTGLSREFNDLELYLMGMFSAAEVKEHFVLQDQNQTDQLSGGLLKGPAEPIRIADIIGRDGPRVPSVHDTQKDFRIATIVLSKDQLLTSTAMAFFDAMAGRGEATRPLPFTSGFARGITKPFVLATGGRGTLLTTLESGLALGLNTTTFRRGDSLILTANITSGPTPVTADVYIALQPPGCTSFACIFFWQGGVNFTVTPQPILRNWLISPFNGPIFTYTFDGTESVGSYVWLGAFVVPGTGTLMGGITQAPFTFNP
jgi:hypothetical protein